MCAAVDNDVIPFPDRTCCRSSIILLTVDLACSDTPYSHARWAFVQQLAPYRIGEQQNFDNSTRLRTLKLENLNSGYIGA